MMRPSIGTLVLVSGISLFASVTLAKPNIVLIMADDMAWGDTSNKLTTLGLPSDYYETPAIDRLAAEGMAFTNAYSSGVNCAPTRSALLTGQYAQRPNNNIYNVHSLNRGGRDAMLVGPPQGLPTGTDGIPNGAITYAEVLQEAGYRTAHFGKFHVVEGGASDAKDIVDYHGFHKNYGGTTAGHPHQYHAIAEGDKRKFGGGIHKSLNPFASDYTAQYLQENVIPYASGVSQAEMDALVGTRKHLSDGMTDAAIEFMEQEKEGPFLLQFNPYAVHTPIQSRSDLVNKYQNKPKGAMDKSVKFGALLDGLDQNVGRLIHYLNHTEDPKNPGKMLAQNTIVFFVSDNGGVEPQSNNRPFEGEKGELDEGGIRVPMIVWSGDPSLVDAGTINHTPVASIDLYRTFAKLAQAQEPEGVTLDGEDLSGIIADAKVNLGRENLYWHFPGYLISGGRDQRPQTAMRSGDWKLLYSYETQSFELYNLADDISETNNLAKSNPAKLTELGQIMMAWLEDLKSPLATLRTGNVTIDFKGKYYANGTISEHDGTMVIQAGEEVPFVLGEIR